MCWKKLFVLGVWTVIWLAGPQKGWADTIVVGNNGLFGMGPIQTFDLETGRVLASFVPQGAAADSNNGRGLALDANNVYYTELTNAFGPSDGIHVAPYNRGAGGADIRVLPNPRPAFGIQDLDLFGGNLYALTGYGFPANGSPIVFILNPVTGAVRRSIPIVGDPSNLSDGFTVLPNGNFLINNGDQSNVYTEYSSTTGRATGFTITVPATISTGVARIAFHGNSDLVFQTNFNGFAISDLSGNFIDEFGVPGNTVEDIAAGVPEPAGFGLAAAGLAALIVLYSQRNRHLRR